MTKLAAEDLQYKGTIELTVWNNGTLTLKEKFLCPDCDDVHVIEATSPGHALQRLMELASGAFQRIPCAGGRH